MWQQPSRVHLWRDLTSPPEPHFNCCLKGVQADTPYTENIYASYRPTAGDPSAPGSSPKHEPSPSIMTTGPLSKALACRPGSAMASLHLDASGADSPEFFCQVGFDEWSATRTLVYERYQRRPAHATSGSSREAGMSPRPARPRMNRVTVVRAANIEESLQDEAPVAAACKDPLASKLPFLVRLEPMSPLSISKARQSYINSGRYSPARGA